MSIRVPGCVAHGQDTYRREFSSEQTTVGVSMITFLHIWSCPDRSGVRVLHVCAAGEACPKLPAALSFEQIGVIMAC